MSCSLHSFHLYFLFLWHHHLFPFNAINTGSIIKFPLWNVARKNKEIHQLPELKEDWWVPWGSMPKEAFVQDFFSQLGLKCGLLWAVLAQMWKKSGILWSSDYRTASFTNENLLSWCKIFKIFISVYFYQFFAYLISHIFHISDFFTTGKNHLHSNIVPALHWISPKKALHPFWQWGLLKGAKEPSLLFVLSGELIFSALKHLKRMLLHATKTIFCKDQYDIDVILPWKKTNRMLMEFCHEKKSSIHDIKIQWLFWTGLVRER